MTQADYDSILTAVDSNVICRTTFYAVGQTLPDQDVAMAARNYAAGSDPLVLGSLIVVLVLAALMMYTTRHAFANQVKEFLSTERRFSTQETHYKDLWVFCAMMFIAFSAYGFALQQFDYIADRYHFSPVLGIPYWLLGLGFAVSALFAYAKFAVYAVVNWVFFDSESNHNWLVNYLLLTSLAALVLFPISMLPLFSNVSPEVVIWCYVFALVIYESLLIFKLFVNFQIKKYGILLIILYFCSVEVAPVLVLWHIMGWAGDTFIEANVLY